MAGQRAARAGVRRAHRRQRLLLLLARRHVAARAHEDDRARQVEPGGGRSARRGARGGDAGARRRPKADDPSAEEARVVEGTMADNDTVERAWKADGLPPATVNELADALGKVFDLRTVRAGHGYTLRFDAEDHLRAVEYRVAPALAYHVARTPRPTAWKAHQGREAARDAQRRDRRRDRLVALRRGQAHGRIDVAGRLVRRHVRVGHQLLHRLATRAIASRSSSRRSTSAASSTSTGACSPPSTRGARAPSARSGSSRRTASPGGVLHRARREHRQVAA